MLRILFCNIAWMDYYKGIVPGKDEPKGDGSYVKAHRGNQFFGMDQY